MSNRLSSQQINDFIESQKAAWPLAADNFKALDGVRVKNVELPGWTVKVQFNPARIVSSGAKVDAKTIRERKCFLCEANRPAEQQGIDWGGRYTVLVNPFPIFPRHLTIPDKSHTDQLIAGRIADMARLAADLNEYTIFYNGPRCGASAPDHMHFQAGNSDFLTLAPALEDCELKTIATDGESVLALADSLPLRVFVIDAYSPEAAQRLFDRLYRAMPVPEGEREPMMNLLCYATAAGVRLVVIPRKRHRPSFYGTEGEGTMLLSPASVDMGGVFITPLEKDFDALDAETVIRVFDELCLNADEINRIASDVE
ncbi:MAG: DUF4922 domain-containing protein [Bacteroidales bacterium]|nr:DUF4922 domain-containing protein [Bacteroidales bacterium]